MLSKEQWNAVVTFCKEKCNYLEIEYIKILAEPDVEYGFSMTDNSWQDIKMVYRAACGHEETITMVLLGGIHEPHYMMEKCSQCYDENPYDMFETFEEWRDAYTQQILYDYENEIDEYYESFDREQSERNIEEAVEEYEREGNSNLKLGKLLKLLRMTQEEVANYMFEFLKGAGYNIEDIEWSDGAYIWAKGDRQSNVMLMGHMDTVRNENNLMSLSFNKETGIIRNLGGDGAGDVLGGDDRCAMFLIQEVIIQSGIRPDVLLTYDEEIGGVGVGKFCKDHKIEDLKHIHWTIEPDKSFEGKDNLVWCRYDDDSDIFEKFMKENYPDMEEIFGSYTDMCDIQSDFGINGINIDACYNNQHTKSEYIDFYRMPRVIQRMIDMIKLKTIEVFAYEENYAYSYNYSAYGGSSGRYNSGIFVKDDSTCAICGWLTAEYEMAKIGDELVCYDCCEELDEADIKYLLYGANFMEENYSNYEPPVRTFSSTYGTEDDDVPFDVDLGECMICQCPLTKKNAFPEYTKMCNTCAGVSGEELNNYNPQDDIRCYCRECCEPILFSEEPNYMAEDVCDKCVKAALDI